MDITSLTLNELAEKLKNREISSKELTNAYLKRIGQDVDKKIRAYLTVCSEGALKDAEAADKRLKQGNATPLTGIPFGIKDIFTTKGVRIHLRLQDTRKLRASLRRDCRRKT